MNIDKIGKWKVTVLETGEFWLDGGAMMGSVPKVLWEKTNPPDDLNRICLSMRCLLLDDGENVVLIETGIGDKNSQKFINMFNIKQDRNALSNTLSKHNYYQENITHVILTHLHFDHAGGATKIDENGKFVPMFPNAEYFISKTNWDAGLNPSPRDRASYLKENYLPLLDNKVLNFVDDNTEIIDGISTYVVNGHTYGQQLVKISDCNRSLIFCSDLIPLRSHIRLPWIMGYDLNAVLTLEEKDKFLNLAAKNNWILFFYHDPDTIAVTIKKDNDKFKVVNEIRRRTN
jgi:glyoxylase-like metal-dependent hydrolase (beta-lactamase superfamily II)